MIITTSRKPSQRTRSFVNDLARVFNFEVQNRGKVALSEIVENKKDIVIIEEFKGNPARLKLYDFKLNKILSMNISLKLQREVSGKVFKTSGNIGSLFDKKTEHLKGLFYDFLFSKLKYDECNFSTALHFKYVDSSTFYIEIHDGLENIGPSIKVKTVVLMDIE